MKLEKRAAAEIAEKCAQKLISHFGDAAIKQVPYDAILSEIAEMMEDIEDKVDTIVNNKVEESLTNVRDIEELWEDR